MAKKEVQTDLWVYDLLKDANIKIDPLGSSIKEIDSAFKTLSKELKGKRAVPKFCGLIKDFVIVIEDKADIKQQVKWEINGKLDRSSMCIQNYALNGAYFYGRYILEHTNFNKVLAFGISGNEKHHIIKPIYLEKNIEQLDLPEVESFISFTENNIDEYYIRELHEYLRNYGNLSDKDKPLVVSGILLALKEMDYNNFSLHDLNGNKIYTDGEKIMRAISDNLKRSYISKEEEKKRLLSQFSIIQDTVILNEINEVLGKTPLCFYTEFLYEKMYQTIRYHNTSEDYLGRFYGEFMSYSGGEGQSLGIILTPKHICNLFSELIDLKPNDIVLDPCCGTGGFLVADMYDMLNNATLDSEKLSIMTKQLYGFELQPYMFTIAVTNMLLRGCSSINLICEDFLAQDPHRLQLLGATVGMMNPPYSMGKVSIEKCELNFIEHLLNSLVCGAKCIVIVPQSAMTGKSNYEKDIKDHILKYHTLEGVITLNVHTFHGVGTSPCIAIFTAGIPHDKEKLCKFIDFSDDGFVVQKHRGLVETERAKDRKQHLLDVWFERILPASNFCVKTKVSSQDEWLHSFYYFNDEIPKDEDFENVVADYLTYEFQMISHNRGYLFGSELDE